MSSINRQTIYNQYLAATQALQRLAEVEAKASVSMSFSNKSVLMTVAHKADEQYSYYSPEEKEAFVNQLLEKYSDFEIQRNQWSTKYPPDTVLSFEASFGIKVKINFGELTCEKVQVGTQIVEKPDPDEVAKVPMITVEEPIYEYLCPDELQEV